MAREFRQIKEACDIFEFPSGSPSPQIALPGQIIELLPIPAAAQDPASFADFYFGRVYDDDGIRFIEGSVERQFTRPLEQTLDAGSFAIECSQAAALAGVSSADLLAVANFLSGAQNIAARNSSAAGPFLFLEKSWASALAATPELGLTPSDRFDPYKQAAVAAAEAAATQQKFAGAGLLHSGAAEHAFVRLFGQQGADILVGIATQPGSPDPSIESVLATYCTNELQGTVQAQTLVSEIEAALPNLLGPATARLTASKVLQALRTALQPPLQQAQQKLAPIDQGPAPQLPQPSDPSSLVLGVNAVFQNEITAAANACRMDPAGLAALIDAEADKLASGLWDKNSANPKSTARGLTQFLEGTWTFMAKTAASALNQAARTKGFVDANNRIANMSQLLQLRFDPALSITSAAEYAAMNLKSILKQRANYPAFYDPKTPDGLMRLAYLCHHEGLSGALRYLAGGKTQEYVTVLDNYIDRKIVPTRFRTSPPPARPNPPVQPGAPLAIPTNVAAIPDGNPIAFAALAAAMDQWHWPVITHVQNAMTVSYLTTANQTAGGFKGRRFLASRDDGRRHHVGMDIFCNEGDVVLAIADGTIVNFYPFYQGTNALLIEHQGVVVNYGEVSPNSPQQFNWNFSQGQNLHVTAGQPIARVGRLNMIHFETYVPGTRQNSSWKVTATRPASLRNPTKLLLGLAAHGIRKR